MPLAPVAEIEGKRRTNCEGDVGNATDIHQLKSYSSVTRGSTATHPDPPLHHGRATVSRYGFVDNRECTEEGIMLEQSPLLSEAHLAIEHVRRLKQLARQRPIGRRLQRRVRALEEAALRMELEARAQSVSHWRAQDAPQCSLHAVESCGAYP